MVSLGNVQPQIPKGSVESCKGISTHQMLYVWLRSELMASELLDTVSCMQVDMTSIDAVQSVMEEFAPDTPKRRTLQERKAMLAKGRR